MSRKEDGIDELMKEFKECQQCARLEELSDLIGKSGYKGAIPLLISRLGDERIREDCDAESALCDALVELGAMHQVGNLTYKFHDVPMVERKITDSIPTYLPYIASKYF
ncbi:MAG: hypothetical protein ABIK28_25545 [Planctomycetota bacterium]